MNPSFEGTQLFAQLKKQHQLIQAVRNMMKNMEYADGQALGMTHDFEMIEDILRDLPFPESN